VRGHTELVELLARADAPERAVVQQYLPNPLLIDGLKFDLRLYVVLTCASPLQAFLSTRGVARFASHPYQAVDASNQGDLLMHLSNSSINQVASGVTNKWALPKLWERLRQDGVDVDALWADVHRLVALTLAAMQPAIAHAYTTAFTSPFVRRARAPAARVTSRKENAEPEGSTDEAKQPAMTPVAVAGVAMRPSGPPAAERAPHVYAPPEVGARRCFHVLGFDVMLDEARKPWLIEVNHSPSMALAGNDADEVDAKSSVIAAALRLGIADDHPPELCKACEVEPLHPVAGPLCSLESLRALFEAVATSRAAQQWTISYAAFERLLAPVAASLLAHDSPSTDLRTVFAQACARRADVGSGWEAPAADTMTLWQFTEAMLRLAERMPHIDQDGVASDATQPVQTHAPSGGLAQSLERLVASLVAARSSSA